MDALDYLKEREKIHEEYVGNCKSCPLEELGCGLCPERYDDAIMAIAKNKKCKIIIRFCNSGIKFSSTEEVSVYDIKRLLKDIGKHTKGECIVSMNYEMFLHLAKDIMILAQMNDTNACSLYGNKTYRADDIDYILIEIKD